MEIHDVFEAGRPHYNLTECKAELGEDDCWVGATVHNIPDIHPGSLDSKGTNGLTDLLDDTDLKSEFRVIDEIGASKSTEKLYETMRDLYLGAREQVDFWEDEDDKWRLRMAKRDKRKQKRKNRGKHTAKSTRSQTESEHAGTAQDWSELAEQVRYDMDTMTILLSAEKPATRYTSLSATERVDRVCDDLAGVEIGLKLQDTIAKTWAANNEVQEFYEHPYSDSDKEAVYEGIEAALAEAEDLTNDADRNAWAERTMALFLDNDYDLKIRYDCCNTDLGSRFTAARYNPMLVRHPVRGWSGAALTQEPLEAGGSLAYKPGPRMLEGESLSGFWLEHAWAALSSENAHSILDKLEWSYENSAARLCKLHDWSRERGEDSAQPASAENARTICLTMRLTACHLAEEAEFTAKTWWNRVRTVEELVKAHEVDPEDARTVKHIAAVVMESVQSLTARLYGWAADLAKRGGMPDKATEPLKAAEDQASELRRGWADMIARYERRSARQSEEPGKGGRTGASPFYLQKFVDEIVKLPVKTNASSEASQDSASEPNRRSSAESSAHFPAIPPELEKSARSSGTPRFGSTFRIKFGDLEPEGDCVFKHQPVAAGTSMLTLPFRAGFESSVVSSRGRPVDLPPSCEGQASDL